MRLAFQRRKPMVIGEKTPTQSEPQQPAQGRGTPRRGRPRRSGHVRNCGNLRSRVVNFDHRGPVVRRIVSPSPHGSVAVIGDENAHHALPPPLKEGVAPMKRRRIKQTIPLDERLTQEAERLRQLARGTPPGIERERMIRRARQAETASHISERFSSQGLRAPT